MPGKPKAQPKKAQPKKNVGKPFIKNDVRINRNGRPKKGMALTEILSEALDEVKNGKTRRETITDKIISLAESGDIAALKYIFDRIDGKPENTINNIGVIPPETIAMLDAVFKGD